MTSTNNISSCFWFDNQAEEAANFYTSAFDNAEITETTNYDKPSAEASGNEEGSVMTVDFEIEGFHFMALNGGPQFKINPSISFFLNFDTSKDKNASESLDRIWEKLAKNGNVLMELEEYPFSPKYGWVQDQFGVTWQLILTNPDGDDRPFVVPSFMFSKDNTNKAEQAVEFYTDTFSDAEIGLLARYPEETGPVKEGSIMFGDFRLADTWLSIMDSGTEQPFTFNEAVSLMIHCEDQNEIDYYWDKLSAVPKAEACGWLKDQYGVSWQVVPENMAQLTTSEDVTKALMQMEKIDIEELKQAGNS